MRLLDALRIFGPITTEDLMLRTSETTDTINQWLLVMGSHGMIRGNSEDGWDLTEGARRQYDLVWEAKP